MFGVVNESGATTGRRCQLPGIEVCGKTGTAQLASYNYMKSSGRAKELRENAWFVGFAPRENPEIVVVALFEHGEHGQYAAGIVRDVIKAYFDKKTRLEAMRHEQQKLASFLAPLTAPAGSGNANAGKVAPVPVAILTSEAPATATPNETAEAPTPGPRPPTRRAERAVP